MVKLDPKQEKIVYYPGDKPLSVEAGPGAGKTRVIIERVKHLLSQDDVTPESLLVITFTRKAADELKDRLSKEDIPKSDVDLMQISTIHGFCSKILEGTGAIGFDVIDDDINKKNNMFIAKHLKKLGFVNEFSVKARDIRDIVRKYNEYTTFKVDTKKLVEYIKEVRPMSDEYLTFVKKHMEENDGKFPFNEVREDDELKKSYYNAKYLKIAESYPEYLKLLADNNLTDFSLMQVNTLEYLEKNPETQFKNVLIDEFQDTDPVQMKIFEILMDNADSFMVVGDVEQSIYGFRGSIENYFKKLFDDHGDKVEKKDLSINYRSTNEIIDFSEKYIHEQKVKHSSKGDAEGARDVSRDVYYMVSDDNESEAEQLVNLILNLKNTGKIDEYSDIGILLRSVKSDNNCINPLIRKLEENDIEYQVKGRSDLLDKPEIKSILTLIYYIIQNDDEHNPIFNSWERDWLTLKAYTDESFKQTLVNLSDETKEIFNSVQDRFEAEVVAVEKEVYKELVNKTSRISTFSGVFKNRDDDVIAEIFRRVSRPIITLENLRKWGVTNQDDLTFFYLLEQIKNEYLNEDVDWEEKPTILELYLKLLTITDYLDEEFINTEENKHQVENIALLSNTLFNYEQVRDPKDLSGVFWFLYHNIDEYGAYAEGKGVQIMTVHKSKGLEFPVVIVGSLSEGKFPMSFKDPNPPSGYAFIGGKIRPVYYSPNDCLEYKPFGKTKDENGNIIPEEVHEKMAHDEEEERIVYVAITRAKDTLILSNISPEGSEDLLDKAMKYVDADLDEKVKKQYFDLVPKGDEKVQSFIDSNSYCKPLRNNFEVIKPIECYEEEITRKYDVDSLVTTLITFIEEVEEVNTSEELEMVRNKTPLEIKEFIEDDPYIPLAWLNNQVTEDELKELLISFLVKKENSEGEPIQLSFTSLQNYQECPLKFRLANDFGLKTSEPRRISDGIFIHKAFEVINKKIKDNDNVYIGDEEVKSIVANLFYKSKLEDNPDEDKEFKLARITDDILYYYNNDGKDLKILDCEVPFYIKKKNYSLNGVIDLIYETENGNIGILDYKNTKSGNSYISKYTDQLYTYILGLSDENHRYAGHEIEELNIYAIKSKKTIPIPINPIEIEELAKDIESTAQNIDETKFSSAKGKHCDKCQYSVICKGTKGDTKLPPEPTSTGSDNKFCHQCGNKLEAGMKFCPSCGTKL